MSLESTLTPESPKTQTIIYGDEALSYQVYHGKSGDSKKLAIHVRPNGDIKVDAPPQASDTEIKAAVLKRAQWILSHRDEALNRLTHVLPKEYVSGESQLYLGKRYVLKVILSQQDKVKLVAGKLMVECKHKDKVHVAELVKGWYRKRAREVFKRRLTEVFSKLSWLETPPQWKLLSMKKQWGSCSPAGLLSLNPELVKAPTRCIDYVLLHELCHLRQHNHSPEFYRLLTGQMPDWQVLKEKLDDMAELILRD